MKEISKHPFELFFIALVLTALTAIASHVFKFNPLWMVAPLVAYVWLGLMVLVYLILKS